MNPADIGSAYNEITHLWQSEKFKLANGMEAHKKALSFVKGRGKALDIGCGSPSVRMSVAPSDTLFL
ncbi:MAG: hypothetical protein ACTJIA_15760 [Halomonas sp.]|uniref:hypothetical protein n=1 Tax=Halomonas sp. AOP31-B1-25 TaxID=3457694 RepID=UPI003FD90346